ncbi:MAG TPA: MG2 domain-containing protein [Drouetiella sp.]
MYSNNSSFRGTTGNVMVSWQFIILQVLMLLGVAVLLDKPTGSLTGKIALQQGKFGLYSYDLSKDKAYAIAIGPRGTQSDERGVWVKPDGSFRFDRLPVGEYQLKVRAPGFGNEYVDNLLVTDSQLTTMKAPVKMALLQPSLSIGSNVRCYTTKEFPSLWINGVGLKHTHVKIYKTDILELTKTDEYYTLGTDFRLTYNKPEVAQNPFIKAKPTLEFDKQLASNSDDSSYTQCKADHTLPPGDYVIQATGDATNGSPSITDYSWFAVTNLGMIIKRAPNETVVRAIDLTTLKPISGAVIKCGEDLSVEKEGKTGADGFVHIPMQQPASDVTNGMLDVIGSYGPYHAFGDISWYSNGNEHYKTYTYTDRPVYRLGQTVFFKGLSREKTIWGYKNPGANIKVDMEVKDPDGNSFQTGTLTTNANGGFHGVIQLAKDAKTGGYSINLTYPDGTNAYEYFEIAQYRKPEYQVEVTPVIPQIVAGQVGKMKVHASYYFGGAVANAHVKYSIYSSPNYSGRWHLMKRPEYFDFFNDWDGEESAMSFGGDLLKEGTANLDANGDALVDVPTTAEQIDVSKPYDYSYLDKNYKVDVEVTDISRLTVVGSGNMIATAGDFALFVETGSYVTKAGDNVPTKVQAVDYKGNPVANQEVTLQMVHWPWDSNKRAYAPRQVLLEQKATTNSNGQIEINLPTKTDWPTDTVYLSATATDKEKHLVFDDTNLWLANYSLPYMRNGTDAEGEVMSIKMDKKVYKVGETAKVMITGPVSGADNAEAIVSIEGPRIYNVRGIKMGATAQLVEVPIKEEYAPNVYVNVSLVDKNHKFYTQEKVLQVSPENNFLQIAINSDKQKYKPGDTVKYTIAVKHQDGKPAAHTDLSLGVVDESIYAIRPETAEDIRKFFYVRRDNDIQTVCSFPEEYSGGPDKAEPKMRKDFKDTAAWIPDITTDDKGIATANVKLPDNLTTWRATVRGIDMKTCVGAATQKIVSTQDLILRLALPRFFSQGDDGQVAAIVHNYSDKQQTVNLTMSMSGQFQTKTPMTQKLVIDPEKAQRFIWPVHITGSGTGVLQCKAIGSTASDAMETKLPIRPLGILTFSSKSGVVTDASKTIEILVGLSGDAERSTAKYDVSIASSTMGPVLGNFGSLIQYPYGCTEQTMSKLVPSIVAKELQIRLHQPVKKADADLFEIAYKASMMKLSDYHHNDGGWGWWKDDQSNTYLTALVVDGLRMLQEVGYKPNPQLIETGRKWLKTNTDLLAKQLSDPKLVMDDWLARESRVDLARMVYTSSFWKEPISAVVKAYSVKQINHCTPEALAYYTLAFHNSKDDVTAKLFYDRLIQMANKSDEFMNWEHNYTLYKKLGLKVDEDYTYRFTSVESTALGLKAVLSMEPKNFDRIEAIKKWIMLQRTKDGWDNTKTTSEVFMVLLQDELQSREMLGKGNFKSRIALDQKSLLDFVSNEDDLYASQATVHVPIPDSKATLTISKDGPGRMYWNSLITYFRKMVPGDQTNYKGLPQGLKMTRKFYHIVPVATTSDGSVHFKTEEIKDGMIKAGETVMMKTIVESPISLPYIMVDAALPSGAEVVDDSDKDGATDTSTSDDKATMEGDWGSNWWSHQDILDDRIVYFGTQLPQGKSEFHTMLRMELPGNINVNPISLEGMYTNAVRGYSALDLLHINE